MEVALFIRSFSKKDHSEKVNEEMLKGPGRGLSGGLVRTVSVSPTISFEYELL